MILLIEIQYNRNFSQVLWFYIHNFSFILKILVPNDINKITYNMYYL